MLGSYDQDDLFGKRKGIEHSPHIRAQLDLDTRMVWAGVLLTFVALGFEFGYHDEFVPLRNNFVLVGAGKFEEGDFK